MKMHSNNQRDLNKFIEQMKEEKDNLTLQIHNKQLRLNKNENPSPNHAKISSLN